MLDCVPSWYWQDSGYSGVSPVNASFIFQLLFGFCRNGNEWFNFGCCMKVWSIDMLGLRWRKEGREGGWGWWGKCLRNDNVGEFVR